MATGPTSFDARMESEISCSEMDCPWLVTAVGINNKNNKSIAKTRPSEPKSTPSGSFAVSVSLSVERFKLECLSDQCPSADDISARTHTITMITNAHSRKAWSITPLRGKSRGSRSFQATSMRSASQLAEADVRNESLITQYKPQEWTDRCPEWNLNCAYRGKLQGSSTERKCWQFTFKSLQFGSSLFSKPVIQQGQILQVKADWQVEKVEMNIVPAASRSAVTSPEGRTTAVDAVVVRDFFPSGYVS